MPKEWVEAPEKAMIAANANLIKAMAAEIQARKPLVALALREALAQFDYRPIRRIDDEDRCL